MADTHAKKFTLQPITINPMTGFIPFLKLMATSILVNLMYTVVIIVLLALVKPMGVIPMVLVWLLVTLCSFSLTVTMFERWDGCYKKNK